MTTDKQPASKPPIEQVGPYRNNTAPAAAKAGVGAKSLAEIQDALDCTATSQPRPPLFRTAGAVAARIMESRRPILRNQTKQKQNGGPFRDLSFLYTGDTMDVRRCVTLGYIRGCLP